MIFNEEKNLIGTKRILFKFTAIVAENLFLFQVILAATA